MNKNIIIVILAAIIVALIVFTCHSSKTDNAPVIISIPAQKDTLAKKEQMLLPVVDSLKKVIAKTDAVVDQNKKSVAYYQGENKRLIQVVKSLQHDTVPASKDNEYYSQKDAINDLLKNSQLADSLCNITIGNLDYKVENLKKVINLKDSLNSDIRIALNSAWEQQHISTDYTKTLEKKLERTKIVAAAIIVGLIALKIIVK